MLGTKQRITDMPKISVVIPAYNQAQYLDEAIQSVLRQTFTDFEIIVVDDGSTDHTAEVAKAYGNKIHYIYQENRGLAGARNTGIRAARGEFIGLLDSDDVWLPEYLEKMMELVQGEPDAAVYYSQAQCIDADGHLLPQLIGYQDHTKVDVYQSVLRANFLMTNTILMRRQYVCDKGLFNENLRSCEDFDLWLRLLPDKRFIGTETILAYYRMHSQSLSTNIENMQKSYQLAIENNFGLNDDRFSEWTSEKRRAYGGLYRYNLLTSVRRKDNWDVAEWLGKAIIADPSLSNDIDLFYELVLGSTPTGYRNGLAEIDLVRNASKIKKLLNEVFTLEIPGISKFKGVVISTAYQAIGMFAYNSGNFALYRHYFFRAGMHNPLVLVNRKMLGNYVKSFLGRKNLKQLRSSLNFIKSKAKIR